MAIQILVSYGAKDILYTIEKDDVLIGRPSTEVAPDLDLSPDDKVSRKHARLWKAGNAYWIEDIGSKHGTLINGVKINYQRELQQGDRIAIGETRLTLQMERQPPATSRVPPDI
jgi:pSer/pThr/pTyr-binding forkhead associated (FHA) protein